MKKLNRTTVNTPERPIKVLQFGEGNFLRAFADWAIDILNEKTGFNGNIQIIQPIDQGMSAMINDQDGLYHVVLNGIENGEAVRHIRLISSVVGAINPYEDFEAFLKTAENDDLELILSNTTEAGIAFEASDIYTELPSSFPGKLTVLLHHRFKYFNGDPSKAITIIPCELIESNGTKLKEVILKYIDLWALGEDFKSWIHDHTVFCNTLVDRIVPGFPRDSITEIQQEIGFEDNLVVTAEPFHLWVIEGPETVSKLLPADKAGLDIKFVSDQTPYRTRKVRILNGAHTAMVPVAYLKGIRTVKEAVDDIEIREFLTKTIYDEIIPTLNLSREELTEFADSVIERFENPYIRHELISISLNSISKFKVRVLPSFLEYIQLKNGLPANLTISLAALLQFYRGEYNNEEIPLNDSDAVLSFMTEVWKNNTLGEAVHQILSKTDFWGMDLSTIDGLEDSVVSLIREKRFLPNANS